MNEIAQVSKQRRWNRTTVLSIDSALTIRPPLPIVSGIPHFVSCSSGFCFRPLFFILYTTPHCSVNQTHSLDHHLYAEDTQIYLSLTTPDTNCFLNQLSNCLHNTFHWMIDSKLKLNADKTEFHMSGIQKQRGKNMILSPVTHEGRLST